MAKSFRGLLFLTHTVYIKVPKGSSWPVSWWNVERPECRSCHTASRTPTI